VNRGIARAAEAAVDSATRDAAHAAAEGAARTAYGRLLSWLAWQWRDIAAAEDAIGDALVAALATWPRDGVPTSPEGWLLTAARRNLLKAARHRRVVEDPAVTVLLPDATTPAEAVNAVPDARLRLMFVCAHPAIEASVRSALMLQTVLGVEAARIARACLVEPEAMTKRLVRAKAKIKATGLRVEEPEARDLAPRLAAVLEAIYGAHTLDWNEAAADGPAPPEPLAEEALHLARVAASLLPHEPEALGLLALLLLDASRAAARRDEAGRWIALHEQDPARWDAQRIDEAEALLHAASRHRRPGPFQLEAAIQLAHASRRQTGTVPWGDIRALYEGLVALHPTVGARIGHALAVAWAESDPGAGLERLETLDPKRRAAHQGWWAARAHLLERAGARDEALAAYERALALTRSAPLRATLEARQRALAGRVH
jgi:RNA polymerase sigma-70 factor (ECF subfamily)